MASNEPPDWYMGTSTAPITIGYIPEMNQTFLGSCESQDKFVKLFDLLYKVLIKKEAQTTDGRQVNYLFCDWMNIDDGLLQQFADLGIPGLTRINRHPLWLLRFILCLLNTNVAYTRTMVTSLTPSLTDSDINAILLRIFSQDRDDRADADAHMVTCYNRAMVRFVKILRYCGNRVRRLIEIVTFDRQIEAELIQAEASYQDLLMSLITRNETYSQIQKVSITKKRLIHSIQALMKQKICMQS